MISCQHKWLNYIVFSYLKSYGNSYIYRTSHPQKSRGGTLYFPLYIKSDLLTYELLILPKTF